MQIAGFDWDDGNWPKCGKHGLSQTQIESVFVGYSIMRPDKTLNLPEPRFNMIGQTSEGRFAFVVFILRKNKVRPISARYMHAKEIKDYEP